MGCNSSKNTILKSPDTSPKSSSKDLRPKQPSTGSTREQDKIWDPQAEESLESKTEDTTKNDESNNTVTDKTEANDDKQTKDQVTVKHNDKPDAVSTQEPLPETEMRVKFEGEIVNIMDTDIAEEKEDQDEEPESVKPQTQNQTTEDQEVVEFSEFEKQVLEAHNACRASHGCTALVLSRSLCDMARKHCDNVIEAGQSEHSTEDYTNYKQGHCGQNLYQGSKTGNEGKDAVDSWCTTGEGSKSSEELEAMVGKNTEELGVAYSIQHDIVTVTACYYPAAQHS